MLPGMTLSLHEWEEGTRSDGNGDGWSLAPHNVEFYAQHREWGQNVAEHDDPVWLESQPGLQR